MVDAQGLMEQAPDTIMHYSRRMMKFLDGEFGEGFCKEHPEILAQYVTACVADFHTAILRKNCEDRIDHQVG